jgi:hypothetical protein
MRHSIGFSGRFLREWASRIALGEGTYEDISRQPVRKDSEVRKWRQDLGILNSVTRYQPVAVSGKGNDTRKITAYS